MSLLYVVTNLCTKGCSLKSGKKHKQEQWQVAGGPSPSESPVWPAQGNEDMSDLSHVLLEPLQWTRSRLQDTFEKSLQSSQKNYIIIEQKVSETPHWKENLKHSLRKAHSAYVTSPFSSLQKENLKKNYFWEMKTTSLQFAGEFFLTIIGIPKGKGGPGSNHLTVQLRYDVHPERDIWVNQTTRRTETVYHVCQYCWIWGTFLQKAAEGSKISQERFQYLPSIIHKAFAWTEYDLTNK